ncbi:GDSL esterase/lipase EXL3-like [Solanum dulcamara]|uniref:GDSL esterase/lipase EXL3-like n=1 Tax=Solanum dulcamara TaxID=45834 RepID=UPI002486B57F|nr:GDSL esterase/lipase EXL3-like [Solanum dulcamara]
MLSSCIVFLVHRIVIMALLCVVFILFFSTCEAKLQLPKHVNITGVFAFGDSIVDQGNNNNLTTHAKCNYLPYGKDFMGGNKPTGRFSNARTPADMLVEDFGIKKLMPAYLDQDLKVEDLKTGVSFASGASGYDLLTPIVASALPLSVQLALFQQYIWKMNGFIGEEAAKDIVKKSLYIVVAGSDDLCNTYFMLKFPRKIQYNIDSYTNLMVDGASNFVNDLYNMGARRIWIFGLPPIGCLPSQRLRGGGFPKVCVEEYNQAAQMTNTKLSAKIYSLNEKLPQSELLYINIYDPLLDIIVNHHKYGFEDAKSACCIGGNEFLLCSNTTGTCENDTKYLFWDSYHLTEKGYRILLDQIFN